MNYRHANRRGGFTLIEVLLVLVILVIIASLAAVAIGPRQRAAYINAAKTQINAFHTPLEAYRLDLKTFPTSSQGLQALRTIPADLASPTRWQGPYLDNEIPLDPWDNEYRYEYPGKRQADRPDIWSLGPDGADGTEDDIGNWMTSRTER
ncbi:MAG: type II secretion system major pseudopilin GspG [Pirellulaceae bacterium]|nr:type II secretion system major pseudopilin GspG [Pirellulaceae bacterium]